MLCPKGYGAFLSSLARRFSGGFPKNAHHRIYGSWVRVPLTFQVCDSSVGRAIAKSGSIPVPFYGDNWMSGHTSTCDQEQHKLFKEMRFGKCSCGCRLNTYMCKALLERPAKTAGNFGDGHDQGRRGVDKPVLPECPRQWPGPKVMLFFRPSGRVAAACFPFKNNVESKKYRNNVQKITYQCIPGGPGI